MKRWSADLGSSWAGILILVAILLALVATPSRVAAQIIAVEGTDTLVGTRQDIFSGLANQVGTLPNPTGGGFVFRFDPATGVFSRATDSFGPVFANRAETTGKGKLTLTTSYSLHTFDELDGVDLRNGELKGVLGVADLSTGGAAVGVFNLKEEVRADVFTVGGLYGVTDRIDVGITLPILKVQVKETITLESLAPCTFDGVTLACQPQAPANAQDINKAEQTGIGDLVLRGKYNFWQEPELAGGRAGLAVALAVTLPTGDKGERAKFNDPLATFISQGVFQIGDPPLGTGIVRVKPQLIFSGSWFGFAPHANVGFELGTTQGITNDFVYEVGFDYTFFGRVTVSADVLGRHALSVDRLKMTTIGPVNGKASADTVAGSFGIKANPFGTLLIFANVLIPLNDTGLRDDLTPTVGVEWTW